MTIDMNFAAKMQASDPMALNGAYVGGAGEAGAVSGGVDIRNLSAEDLLAYVESQLADIDGVIQDYLDSAQTKRARMAELRDYRTKVEGLKSSPMYTPEGYREKAAEFDRLAAETTDPALKQEIQQFADDMRTRAAAAESSGLVQVIPVPETDVDNRIHAIEDQIQNLSDSTETQMMRLSQLMQTRSRVIQFASNAMASIDADLKQIINNMRS